jgi:hypothetical protein
MPIGLMGPKRSIRREQVALLISDLGRESEDSVVYRGLAFCQDSLRISVLSGLEFSKSNALLLFIYLEGYFR